MISVQCFEAHAEAADTVGLDLGRAFLLRLETHAVDAPAPAEADAPAPAERLDRCPEMQNSVDTHAFLLRLEIVLHSLRETAYRFHF